MQALSVRMYAYAYYENSKSDKIKRQTALSENRTPDICLEGRYFTTKLIMLTLLLLLLMTFCALSNITRKGIKIKSCRWYIVCCLRALPIDRVV